MMPRLLALLGPLALVTCGDPDITPKSGTWTYNGSMLATNSCGDTAYTDPEGTFTVAVSGDHFTVDDGNNDPFTCSFGGGSYDCPQRVTDTIDDTGLDATVTIHASITGDLESATALGGTQTVQIDCTGASCDTVAAFLNFESLPCAYSYTFTATAQ